jgi:hypothetical protein
MGGTTIVMLHAIRDIGRGIAEGRITCKGTFLVRREKELSLHLNIIWVCFVEIPPGYVIKFFYNFFDIIGVSL